MVDQSKENSIWKLLSDELDMWQSTGRSATFWWRDDDAIRHTEKLEQLDQLSRVHGAPLSIAVIPAPLETSLTDYIKSRENFTVLQHGYAHQSHAAKGVKKIEIGGQRELGNIEGELLDGYQILEDAFGDQFVPVLVPPWNRIDSRTYPLLTNVGFTGLSSMWARKAAFPVAGLQQVNCHLDPVNWRHDRGIIDKHLAIEQLHLHLFGRRAGFLDADEPTGILTHHLDQTAEVWNFCDRLFKLLTEHPAASWLDAINIWQEGDLENGSN